MQLNTIHTRVEYFKSFVYGKAKWVEDADRLTIEVHIEGRKHITQRGNRRQQTFFNDGDYSAYLELMADWCREQGVEIRSCCLMPNHTHLIAVPASEDGLRWAIGEAHRHYTRRINFREKWRGYRLIRSSSVPARRPDRIS